MPPVRMICFWVVAGPNQVAALGRAGFCLSSVLQVASHQARVLHGRSVCSVQDVTFSGTVKTSFVWPEQLAVSGCKRG